MKTGRCETHPLIPLHDACTPHMPTSMLAPLISREQLLLQYMQPLFLPQALLTHPRHLLMASRLTWPSPTAHSTTFSHLPKPMASDTSLSCHLTSTAPVTSLIHLHTSAIRTNAAPCTQPTNATPMPPPCMLSSQFSHGIS